VQLYNENNELITALVDRELPADVESDLLIKIKSNADLLYDYKVQLLIKKIVKGCVFRKTPAALKHQIINQIQTEREKKNSNFDFIYGIFRRPIYAFGSALAVITAIILLLFNPIQQNSGYNFGLEQRGQDNMFVQARGNFQSLLNGKLAPQITTTDAEEIKTFFETEGVKYKIIIPEIENYSLVGGVVSDEQGEKLAHHVYADNQGHLIYLFQVDESFLAKNAVLKISDALHSYLDDGNCFTFSDRGVSTLMTKKENNILAIVSNVTKKKLETKFCNI